MPRAPIDPRGGGGFRPGDGPRGERNRQRCQNVVCFECGEKGHYARDCKVKQNKDEGAKDLNEKGSGGAANS